jgi:signal transduction histidine kinase/ligand-binding sensor domain-containing protein
MCWYGRAFWLPFEEVRPKLMSSRAIEQFRRAMSALGLAMLGVLGSVGLASATQSLAQMYHTAWTVRDGAPRAIYSIATTTDGFLWLSTGDGLYRFDGQSFEHYQPRYGDPFPGSFMPALRATADGGLWIGYGSIGAASFLKQGHNRNYGEREGLERSTVLAFAIDAESTVWAAVGPNLKRLEGSLWKTVGKEWNFPEKTNPQDLFVDSRGTLWVASMAGSFYLRKGEHAFTRMASLGGTMRIVEAPKEVIWFSSISGPLQAVDAATGELRSDIAPLAGEHRGIAGTRDGSLWMTSDTQGITRLRDPKSPADSVGPSGNNAEHYRHSDGLTGDFSFMVNEDREGSVWVATTKGLDQFRPAALSSLPAFSGAAEQAIGPAQPGHMFWGAAIVDVLSGRVVTPAPPSVPDITLIYRDPLSRVWFGGRNSLWRFDQRFLAIPLPEGLTGDRTVHSMALDRDGDLWVSVLRNGIYRLHENRWSRISNLLGSENNTALTIMVDSSGRLWFGYAQSNRIQCLDGERLTTYTASDGLDIGSVDAISEVNGRIVVGGAEGLEMLDGNRFRNLRLADNAPIRTVTGLLQPKDGDFWVNEASGIVHVGAEEIRKAQSEPSADMKFTLYDFRDGVDDMSPAFRPRPTIVDNGDGYLYFAMRTSALFIDTKNLAHNSLRPSVEIEALSDGAKDYLGPSESVLPANTDKVTVRFTTASLLIPQRVRFRYRLEGFDDVWQHSGSSQRSAVYSRLPPGHYVFRVSASNNEDVWNEVGASVKFTIPPSFVQTFGFKVLCVALAVALLWLLYRMRLQQITAQMRRRLYERLDERMQIARDLHDTFFQGIQGLLLRFNTATALLKKDDPARAILDEALRQSDLVMSEGREIMLDLRGEVGKTTALAEHLSLFGDECKKTHPVDLRVTAIGNPRSLHPIAFEEILRFGREALTNAFRHSQAKTIEVELHYERNLLRLRVRDDGVGIDQEILSRGFKAGHWGLPGMRERAKKLGGTVELWSRANAGTEIELRVPAAAAYASAKRSWFMRLSRFATRGKRSASDSG